MLGLGLGFPFVREAEDNDMFQFAHKAFSDMADVASQNLFTTSGKVGVVVYGIVGATAIASADIDADLTVGYDGNAAIFMAATSFLPEASSIPAEALWTGTDANAAPTGNAATIFTKFLLLDGQTIELYKTGADAITQGILDVRSIWFPMEDGATVTAV